MKRKAPRLREPAIRRYGPGEQAAPTDYGPGDFILTHSNDLFGRLIRLGESLRYRGDRARFAHWSHAALIASQDGTLIEALSHGVTRSHLSKYHWTEYFVVRLSDQDADARDRQQAVAYAEYCLKMRESYGWLTVCNIALALLTGCKLTFGVDGQVICSGLVARCLERTSVLFDGSAGNISPADLAMIFHVEPPPSGSPKGVPP